MFCIFTQPAMSDDDDDDDAPLVLFAVPTKPAARAVAPVATAATRAVVRAAEPALQNASAAKVKAATAAASFDQLGLDDWAVTNLARLNIFKPSPVQVHCVPPILAGTRLVVALAPTGSGKTAAFALPILNQLARDPFGIYALVLTPTRELAIQIGEQFEALGAPIRCNCQVVIGGMAIVPQQSALAKLPHVVVATPGRLADHINSSSAPRLNRVCFLVLDEADRLLTRNEGFAKDFRSLAAVLSPFAQRQTVLMSATLAGSEVAFACELGLVASDAAPAFEWRADAPTATVSTLRQELVLVPSDAKHAYFVWFLRRYLPASAVAASKLALVSAKARRKKRKAIADAGPGDDDDGARCRTMIVFTSTCESCQLYHEMCAHLGLASTPLHSQLSQGRRLAGLAKFRQGAVGILVATDVASRGLDIPAVDLVLNLDVPREPVNYIHRVGRAARAGRIGRAVTFVTPHDVALVRAVEAATKVAMDVLDAPDDEVALVLHKASTAKREAVLQAQADGLLSREPA